MPARPSSWVSKSDVYMPWSEHRAAFRALSPFHKSPWLVMWENGRYLKLKQNLVVLHLGARPSSQQPAAKFQSAGSGVYRDKGRGMQPGACPMAYTRDFHPF